MFNNWIESEHSECCRSNIHFDRETNKNKTKHTKLKIMHSKIESKPMTYNVLDTYWHEAWTWNVLLWALIVERWTLSTLTNHKFTVNFNEIFFLSTNYTCLKWRLSNKMHAYTLTQLKTSKSLNHFLIANLACGGIQSTDRNRLSINICVCTVHVAKRLSELLASDMSILRTLIITIFFFALLFGNFVSNQNTCLM